MIGINRKQQFIFIPRKNSIPLTKISNFHLFQQTFFFSLICKYLLFNITPMKKKMYI